MPTPPGSDAAGPTARSRRCRTIRPRGDTPALGVFDTIVGSVGPIPHILLRDPGLGTEVEPVVRPAGSGDDDRTIRYRIDGEIARGGIGASSRAEIPTLTATWR